MSSSLSTNYFTWYSASAYLRFIHYTTQFGLENDNVGWWISVLLFKCFSTLSLCGCMRVYVKFESKKFYRFQYTIKIFLVLISKQSWELLWSRHSAKNIDGTHFGQRLSPCKRPPKKKIFFKKNKNKNCLHQSPITSIPGVAKS